jgi:uncharacterized protein YbgA (DUF1722 family)
MAHSPRLYAALGRLVAGANALPRPVLHKSYEAQFMSALEVMATPRRHVNVLQHILGYFTDRLDRAARRELTDLFDDYGRGLLPLVVPLTLVRHYVQRFAITYLQAQTYLEPQRADAPEPRLNLALGGPAAVLLASHLPCRPSALGR